jgi:hypothetical protein
MYSIASACLPPIWIRVRVRVSVRLRVRVKVRVNPRDRVTVRVRVTFFTRVNHKLILFMGSSYG